MTAKREPLAGWRGRVFLAVCFTLLLGCAAFGPFIAGDVIPFSIR